MWKDLIRKVAPVWMLNLYFVIRFPSSTWAKYKNDRFIKSVIKNSKKQQKHALANVNKVLGKRPLRCVYFCLFDSVWKYDTVYKQMQIDPRFDPMILICPVVNYGYDNMIKRMNECYKYFSNKEYKVLKSYNEETGEYIDVRNELKPDMIVYTNPYKGLIDDRYYITNYTDILTFYVHYGFNSAIAWDMLYKQLLTNIVWRYYVETDIHQGYVRKYSLNGGRNTAVTGYPGIEELISPKYFVKICPWKSEGKIDRRKRIIWAPHHTIEPVGIIRFSNFIRDAEFMLEMAKKYNDCIQIAFKPHPLLRNKLYEKWGEEKTENYYGQWESMDNTFVIDGDYIDLFLTSDAMIHDSGSFLIEYLYVNKPVMRVMTDENMTNILNSFALLCLDHYYKAYNEQDIEQFIQNVIIGVDPLKEQRTKFVSDMLMPKGGMPSENIINDIIDSIEHQRV